MTQSVAYILYNFGIRIYHLLFLCYSCINSKAAKIRIGRKQLIRYLGSTSSGLPTVWFHCSSLGEWEQTIPVVERLKEKSNVQILVSFYSSSGFEYAKRRDLVDAMIYLPVDFYKAYAPVFNTLNLVGISFTRYDIWPNLVRHAVDRNVPLFLIGAESASLRKYRRSNGFFAKMLQSFSFISCNTVSAATLLNNSGYRHVYTDGSSKLERSAQIAAQEYVNASLDIWRKDAFVIIGGSIWPPEAIMMERLFIEGAIENMKMILVPHEPSHDVIGALQEKYKDTRVLFSQMDGNSTESKVIIMDKVGFLSKIYRFADVAIVGGGFGKGIHNIAEPAASGLAVISGPNNSGFSEAAMLQDAGVYFPIETYKEFRELVIDFAENELKRKEIRTIANTFFNAQSEAAERISQHIVDYAGITER